MDDRRGAAAVGRERSPLPPATGQGPAFGAGEIERWTKRRLYAKARKLGLRGRSRMRRDELVAAISRRERPPTETEG